MEGLNVITEVILFSVEVCEKKDRVGFFRKWACEKRTSMFRPYCNSGGEWTMDWRSLRLEIGRQTSQESLQ